MRNNFSKKTKLAAFERAKGHCENCGNKILTSAEYDHRIEDYLTHDNSLENCVCLCKKCHDIKTKRSRPAIDKTRRIIEKRAGVRKSGRGFQKPPPGYDPWTRRMRGEG
jgi:5-methylcytosine-specific restriction protein A